MAIVTFQKLGRWGRLGNQFFQIAGTIGIARRNGFEFGFPAWKNHDHLERFNTSEDIDVQKYFENPLPLFEGTILREQGIPWGYHDVNLTQSTDIHGHFQSERYFAHCLDEVRHYLRMKDEPEQNEFIAVHYRAGDYGGTYHPRMPLEYYQSAMAEFPGGEFLFFTDDIVETKRIFGDTIRIAGAGYLDDFRLMKRCRHFIIANSSYSAMAAVLGEAPDKRVIAPRPWFGPAAGIDGEDIYSATWKVIDYQKT